mmetsp:Transcript_34384/g.96632  ORF Transcript_34384/g.96632 Transcript_34384/m.96632 type:complete len:268 (-) Transcript_34384:317-1120(-)
MVRRPVRLHPSDQRGAGGDDPLVVQSDGRVRRGDAGLGRGEPGPVAAELAVRGGDHAREVEPHRAHVEDRRPPHLAALPRQQGPRAGGQQGPRGRSLVRRVLAEVPGQEGPGLGGAQLRRGQEVPGVQALRLLPVPLPPRVHRRGRDRREDLPLPRQGDGPLPELQLRQAHRGGLLACQPGPEGAAREPGPGREGRQVLLRDPAVRLEQLPGLRQGRDTDAVLLRHHREQPEPAVPLARQRQGREGHGLDLLRQDQDQGQGGEAGLV